MNIYDNRYWEGQFSKLDYIMRYNPSFFGLILDFGCGTGLLYDYFNQMQSSNKLPAADQNKQFKIIGIDLSNAMISEFNKKVRRPGQKGTVVNLVVCDGENLPFRGALFDEIYALTSLQNLPNLNEGLKQIRRTSSPDCKYGLTFLKKSLVLEKLSELMQSFFPKIHQILPDPTNDLQFDRQYHNLEDWLFVGK